jgi:hypothetical protein
MDLVGKRVKYGCFDYPTDVGVVTARPQPGVVYIKSESILSTHKPKPGKMRELVLSDHTISAIEIDIEFVPYNHKDWAAWDNEKSCWVEESCIACDLEKQYGKKS